MPELRVADSEEAEDESGSAIVAFDITERDKAAIMRDSEHELRRDDEVVGPNLRLDRAGRRTRRDVLRQLDANGNLDITRLRASCTGPRTACRRRNGASWRAA